MTTELLPARRPLGLSLDLTKVFSPQTVQVLLECSRIENFKCKALVQMEDMLADHAYFVISGGLKLTKIEQNRRTILDFAGPLEMVGGPLIMHEGLEKRFPVRIESIGDSKLLVIEKKIFHSQLKSMEDFSQFVAQQINSRILWIQSFARFSSLSVRGRIAELLVKKLAHIPGARISRAEVAQAVGASSETVIRVLSAWEELGIVKFKKQVIQELNIDELSHIIHLESRV